MNEFFLSLKKESDYNTLFSYGKWTLDNIKEIEKSLHTITYDKKIIWDVSEVKSVDSAGILLFIEYFERFKKEGEVEVVGYSSRDRKMYELLLDTDEKIIHTPNKESIFEELGRTTVAILKDFLDFITFLGVLFTSIGHNLIHPRSIRVKEMIYHIRQSGFNALIIIGLTAFLVGMVIAYQGSVQLAKFGADILIVDTVGLSITRELAPMITAIVIAGRSGSAYTAEIGAMKITEEISAMRTMGFDPYHFLVLPRIFALMISLPLLIFFADILGIIGGMVATKMQLGISYGQFIGRLYEVLGVEQYYLGMIKGPIFAFMIASIGCFRGFQVSLNTESIGLQTTSSVVNGIFMVILLDAVFSVIYTEMGFDFI